ncbi:GNAT family N-acetyltransferase [Metabacillus malikii]|uniref:GNAT superfamily N-acetyltransferase n=1 Tax=Metabacillus malikii TaxID=1504265 RepID=A0ABT9ZIF5_9BACI|nr:GNAT family N-acetyltransferase [Metabacillus malikii]MDQ0231318.1 GNAT superfamily N-acetyltransferase [Metabacillus malikii]
MTLKPILFSRELEEQDFGDFAEIIAASDEWRQEETDVDQLHIYLTHYKMYNGEWRVWQYNEHIIGIVYSMEWSPSNEKPWLGTILIHPDYRRKGFAKLIINQIADKLKQQGHSAIFAACPSHRYSWLTFLSNCGFEQFKYEKDEEKLKEYIITVKPL